MVHGCQTCLRVIKNPSEGLYIKSGVAGPNELPLAEQLLDCVPELILQSVEDVMLCHSCVEGLSSAYEFKERCLETQQKIHGFLQQGSDNARIDVGKIAVYYQRMEVIARGGDPTLDESSSKVKKMPYNCTLCQFGCFDKCVLRYHQILHKNKNPPYKCSQCSFIFPSTTILLDHLATHTNERPYACTLCNFVTAAHKELKEHAKAHRKSFQCSICWKRFPKKYALDIHLECHNNQEFIKRYQCGWCNFRCDRVKELRLHWSEGTHQDKDVNKCKVCMVACRTQLGLMQHMKFTHKQSLIDTDDEENVYEDVNCQFSDNEIVVPVDGNTPTSTFVCSKCDVEFRSDLSAVRNINQQFEGINKGDTLFFKCVLCDYYTRKDLRKHIKRSYDLPEESQNSNGNGSCSPNNVSLPNLPDSLNNSLRLSINEPQSNFVSSQVANLNQIASISSNPELKMLPEKNLVAPRFSKFQRISTDQNCIVSMDNQYLVQKLNPNIENREMNVNSHGHENEQIHATTTTGGMGAKGKFIQAQNREIAKENLQSSRPWNIADVKHGNVNANNRTSNSSRCKIRNSNQMHSVPEYLNLNNQTTKKLKSMSLCQLEKNDNHGTLEVSKMQNLEGTDTNTISVLEKDVEKKDAEAVGEIFQCSLCPETRTNCVSLSNHRMRAHFASLKNNQYVDINIGENNPATTLIPIYIQQNTKKARVSNANISTDHKNVDVATNKPLVPALPVTIPTPSISTSEEQLPIPDNPPAYPSGMTRKQRKNWKKVRILCPSTGQFIRILRTEAVALGMYREVHHPSLH